MNAMSRAGDAKPCPTCPPDLQYDRPNWLEDIEWAERIAEENPAEYSDHYNSTLAHWIGLCPLCGEKLPSRVPLSVPQ